MSGQSTDPSSDHVNDDEEYALGVQFCLRGILLAQASIISLYLIPSINAQSILVTTHSNKETALITIVGRT